MDPQDLAPDQDSAAVTGPGVVVPPGTDPHETGPSLVLAGPHGPHALGPATVDSDTDGVADTALVPPPRTAPDHELFSLVTDLDHDGDVDVVTTLSADGSARTVAVDPTVPVWGPEAWEPGWDTPAPPPASLDPATGAWTRSP